MPFVYSDSIPQTLSSGGGEVGNSMAYPAIFHREFAPTFHERGYCAGSTFLGKQFSMSLLQYWVLQETGVMIGEGGAFKDQLSGRFDGHFINFTGEEGTFFGRELESTQGLINFVSARQQQKIPSEFDGKSDGWRFPEDKTQSTFGLFAPILERFKTCELLHQLGADFMLTRALTERGRNGMGPGNSSLLAGLNEQQRNLYTTLLQDRGEKIKLLLYNLVKFYISEAKAYCEHRPIKVLLRNHPPSQFVVNRFKEAFYKKHHRQPTDEDWREFVKSGINGMCTFHTGDDDPLMIYVHKLKAAGMDSSAYDPSSMFNPNELDLPQVIIDAINEIYVNGQASIPAVDMQQLNEFQVSMLDDNLEATFNAEAARQAIISRFSISDGLREIYPDIERELGLSGHQDHNPPVAAVESDPEPAVADNLQAAHDDRDEAHQRENRAPASNYQSVHAKPLTFFGKVARLFGSHREEEDDDFRPPSNP